ncbi:MAG: TIGR00153 family protein, partial [Gemmatimonadetes bacterium]|nr:TIGR00153 family protein [Gemmatimonadota bacterium]NIR79710.1 TIGR00153 family protein [Gemmatimonadota bacterium]NIT88416.1 TIGR00153 family protein [Gemmatimonadota bacterium]NIU32231.1 TIGR00153 family protein [Gemmatimonadota bacterium]NIU36772.1 TIGR00153 family protein [Gemmatimonadota bacterium]
MRTFFELFARSPFEPLVRHAEMVRQVVDQVRPLMEAFVAGDWEVARETHERISRLEHKADEIKQEIRDHLPRSLFLPVDRGDLLSFLKEQDAIADAAEDVAVLSTMRETRVPDELGAQLMELVDQIMKTLDTWQAMSAALPELQESSFTGPEVKKVMDMVQDLHTLEWEADQVQASVSRVIVKHE